MTNRMNNDNQSEKNIDDSLSDGRSLYGLANRKVKEHLSKLAMKTNTEATTSVFSFLLTSPFSWIVILIVIVLILCVFVPVALANVKDSDGRSIYESEDAYNNMMNEAIQATSSAIKDIYDDTVEEMESQAVAYLQTNYQGYEDYIHITYTMDDLNTTASNITGYIQAVNGVLLNYLPIDSNGNHKSGLNTDSGLEVDKENEFNSLGAKYKKCIQEYAKEEPLFQIDLTPDIQQTKIKEIVTDSNGNQNEIEKTVYAGDIYVDVTYDISNYKNEDINEATDIYYQQVKESVSNKEICKSQIQDAINETLYLLTGSKTIPSVHTYTLNDWDMITGTIGTNGSYVFDGTTSEGWTPPVEGAIRSAGTWNYSGGGKHLGYDFAISEGSEIRAVANGIVLVSADGCAYGGLGSTCAGTGGSTSGGNQVYLLVTVQDKLYAVKYLHMKLGSPIKQGTQVKAGDHIGLVGSTGNSSGAHCHVEIFYLGDASNFEDYLNSWNGDLAFGCGWAGSYDGYGRRCDAGYEAPCRIRPETVFGEAS